MMLYGWVYYLFFFTILVVLVKPLGNYMAKVFQGETTFLSRWVTPLEGAFYRFTTIDPSDEMDWKTYTKSVLCFNFLGIIFLYLLLRFQGLLPMNPQSMPAVPPFLAINTAVSFVTNTNWQNYGGETTLSYLTQMLGMTVQNFLSAGTGIAILIAFIRGLTRQNTRQLGNFWVDLTRCVLYILLPLSFIFGLILVSQGVVQTFSDSITTDLIQPYIHEGRIISQQVISVGPAASQIAIKHLGTNGGGFFNANAAHPFENPSALTNFLLMLAQTCIPAALTYTFGKMTGDTRQGWAVLIAMLVIVMVFSGLAFVAEASPNPQIGMLGIDQNPGDFQSGGNMEGKETRNGVASSALFATLTTATSSGAVNSMHDSFSPLGGMVLLLMMQLSEVALGGVGSGLYGMLIFVIVAVFIAGLMVGRTPEYLGKKIEPFEMKMASLIILIMPMIVLFFTALAVSLPAGTSSTSNPGAHGFSQILYAFTSQGNNNGSAFAGLSGNTAFYNLTGAFAMLMGRYWLAIPTLALAGSLASQKESTLRGRHALNDLSALYFLAHCSDINCWRFKFYPCPGIRTHC